MKNLSRLAKLRWLALAILVVLAVGTFHTIYGAAVQSAALVAARNEAERRTSLEVGALLADIDKFRVLPFVLTELPDAATALAGRSAESRGRLDRTFAALAHQTGATVLYAIDANGTAQAASNARSKDSFVGHDFRFRPYFVHAMRAGASEYFAQGSVTGRPGMFLARRVGAAAAPAGVIVVKIEFDRIERLWRSAGRLTMVVDRDGIIVVGSAPELRLRTIEPLPRRRRAEIVGSRQFGGAHLTEAGIQLEPPGFATDSHNRRYILTERRLPLLGWRHIHLEAVEPTMAAANGRVRFATLIFALGLITLLGLATWSLTRRRHVEAARLALEAEVSRRTSELTDAYEHLRREGEEREKADNRYRAAREELAQANRLGSIGTITTSVAHEINQPVAAIRTAAENGVKLVARGQTETVVTNLALIVSLTQRIGAITGELLSYARRGRRELATVALDEVVEGALMLIGHSFVRAGVSLEVLRAPDLPRLHGSRIRLEQVLVNLLHNALDAVVGRTKPRVLLEVTMDETCVNLAVHDNGPGLSPELGDTIFQPFVTSKPHGTGLGLGISREIVADHNGSLVTGLSILGGAVFQVKLPRSSEKPQ